MNKKIGKTALINRLEMLGYSRSLATDIVDDISNIYVTALCEGNSISINKICTIEPVKKEAVQRRVVNEIRQIPERIVLKIKSSKYVKDLFAAQYSEKAKTGKAMRSLIKRK